MVWGHALCLQERFGLFGVAGAALVRVAHERGDDAR